jgi:HlyD family secretion protein
MSDAGQDVRKVLQQDTRARRRRRTLWIGLSVAAVAVLATGWVMVRRGGDASAPKFRTVEAKRGDLKVVVTATGTLRATNTVEVGAEVTGRLVEIPVDFNDVVKPGTLLARIDPTTFQQDVRQASARLASANAALEGARVSAREAATKLARAEDLAKQGLVSPQDLDTLRTAAARAKVDVAAAQAKVAETEAALEASRTRLEKTAILSPITGIVLNRKVELGQTVTAGFQTPVLFQLATDLAEMELTAAIDEADVGRIAEGLEATFTVDAFPNRTFPSRVSEVRNVATTTQNVVTYEAILTTRNEDRTLRPGMTATTTIVASQVKDALLVPNEALRFAPAPPAAASSGRSSGGGLPFFGPPRMGGQTQPARPLAQKDAAAGQGTVWTLADGQPVAHRFRKGETDGDWTEVLDGDLKPGDVILVGNNNAKASGAAAKTESAAPPPPPGPGGGP